MSQYRITRSATGEALTRFIRRLRRPENPLSNVPRQALWSYRAELSKLAAAAASEHSRLQAILALVDEAMRDMDQDAVDLIVSDHAMIRYIERHTDFDVERVKEEILGMVELGEPEVAVRDGVVVTVLPKGVASVESFAA